MFSKALPLVLLLIPQTLSFLLPPPPPFHTSLPALPGLLKKAKEEEVREWLDGGGVREICGMVLEGDGDGSGAFKVSND